MDYPLRFQQAIVSSEVVYSVCDSFEPKLLDCGGESDIDSKDMDRPVVIVDSYAQMWWTERPQGTVAVCAIHAERFHRYTLMVWIKAGKNRDDLKSRTDQWLKVMESLDDWIVELQDCGVGKAWDKDDLRPRWVGVCRVMKLLGQNVRSEKFKWAGELRWAVPSRDAAFVKLQSLGTGGVPLEVKISIADIRYFEVVGEPKTPEQFIEGLFSTNTS